MFPLIESVDTESITVFISALPRATAFAHNTSKILTLLKLYDTGACPQSQPHQREIIREASQLHSFITSIADYLDLIRKKYSFEIHLAIWRIILKIRIDNTVPLGAQYALEYLNPALYEITMIALDHNKHEKIGALSPARLYERAITNIEYISVIYPNLAEIATRASAEIRALAQGDKSTNFRNIRINLHLLHDGLKGAGADKDIITAISPENFYFCIPLAYPEPETISLVSKKSRPARTSEAIFCILMPVFTIIVCAIILRLYIILDNTREAHFNR